MNCQETQDLFDDALDRHLVGSRKRRFDLHLSRCEACRSRFAEADALHRRLFSALNAGAEMDRLPPDFDARLAAILLKHPPRHRLTIPRWVGFAASLLVAAIAMAAGLSYSLFQTVQPTTTPDAKMNTAPAIVSAAAATVLAAVPLSSHASEPGSVIPPPVSQKAAIVKSATTPVASLTSLSQLESLALRAGDAVLLPDPDGGRYVPMDARVATIDTDGRTLIALDAGFSEIVRYPASATSLAPSQKSGSALAVVAPEPQGSGRVFLAKQTRDYWPWNDASKWTNLTDPSDTASFPNGPDDVAMVPLVDGYSVQVFDDTVGEIYIGWRYPSEGVSGGVRLAGRSGETRRITFKRSSGMPGLLRITGVPRYDVSKAAAPTVRLGGGGAATGVTFEMPDGLVLDGGASVDWTDTSARDTLGGVRIRSGVGQMTIPDGTSLRVINVAGSALTCNASAPALLFQNAESATAESGPFSLLGGGTFSYDAVGPATLRDVLSSFKGEVAVRNKQLWSAVNITEAGGGFRIDNPRKTTAPDSSLRLEGNIVWTESEFSGQNGISTSHANGAEGHGGGKYAASPNAIPAKSLVLAGGALKQHAVDGIGPKMPVAPTRADKLVVEDGFSTIILTFNSPSSQTNSLAFGSLAHDGRGTAWMKTDKFISGGNANDQIIIEGFGEHSIGGTGAAGSATAPIVPWIVAPALGGFQGRIGFPSAAADGQLVMTMPASKALDTTSSPDENVFVDGRSLALSEDRMVNSLVVAENASSTTGLGAGRTLTIASGGLALASRTFAGVPAYVGTEADATAGTAGTVVFGGPAYIYACCPDTSAPDEIWASLVAPDGLSVSFPGVLVLGGDQTGIEQEIAVNASTLRLGSETSATEINAPIRLVGGGSRLEIAHPGSLCLQEIRIDELAGIGGTIVPPSGASEPCRKLYIGGENCVRGTWGSSESGAEFVDDQHFAGTGVLFVKTDDFAKPTVIVIR